MKILKNFESFSRISENHIYESSADTRKNVRDIIRIYVEQTKNKGGDEKLCSQTAESIVKAMDNSPKKAFKFFSEYGIGSIPLLDLIYYLFEKYGFFKDNLTYNEILALKESSEEFFDEHEEVIQALSDVKIPAKYAVNKNVSLQSDLIERSENVKNKENVLGKIDDLVSFVKAIGNDNPNEINSKAKDVFLDLAFKFISDYKNSPKLKAQSPKIYEFLESESGDDDVDLATGLGNIGF